MKQKTHKDVAKELKALADPKRAKASLWFFKTGPGEYGEGDKFLGIPVPIQRKVARQFIDIPLSELKELLQSLTHEHRFVALEILVMQYEKGDLAQKKHIFDFYLKNTHWINNWDLVDTSALYIVGDHLLKRNRDVLFAMAKSKNVWDRRISIISTLAFIKNNDFKDTLKIAKFLLQDTHDLIHKAVGWALREVGKRSPEIEYTFLDAHYRTMPRTMLRYAIEKFPKEKRVRYMQK